LIGGGTLKKARLGGILLPLRSLLFHKLCFSKRLTEEKNVSENQICAEPRKQDSTSSPR
jgi:hypothetical protein